MWRFKLFKGLAMVAVLSVVLFSLPRHDCGSFSTVPSTRKCGIIDNSSCIFPLPENYSFQPVGRNGSYVYSAFLDDRPAPDVKSTLLPVLRILAVFRRSKEQQGVVGHWSCLLWYYDLDAPVVVPVVGCTALDREYVRDSVVLATGMIICPLANDSADVRSTWQWHRTASDALAVPLAVSVITTANERPENRIPIVDRRERTEGVDSRRYSVNFAVCIHSPFSGGYTKNNVMEFVEANSVFGAEAFVFYVTPTVPEATRDLLRAYEHLGIVQVRPWIVPRELSGVLYQNGQVLAMNDCLYRMMRTAKYVASHDVDEFIVPTLDDSWQAMIDRIDANSTQPENIASYSFRNRFFPTLANYRNEFNPIVSAYKLRTLLTTFADSFLFRNGDRSKVIVRPERVTVQHVHLIHNRSLVRPTDVNLMVKEKYAVLHHYRSPWYHVNSSQAVTVTRMQHFQSRIVERFADLTKRLNASELAMSPFRPV